MASKKHEVGACGNHCGACLDFLALKKNDDRLRQEVAKKLTEEFGRNTLPEEIGCEGCWGNIHNPLAASLECKIRQCVDKKGFVTCASCEDFPCNIFSEQFAPDSKCAKNIAAIKSVLYE